MMDDRERERGPFGDGLIAAPLLYPPLMVRGTSDI